MADAFLAAVITDGDDIVDVAHLGRAPGEPTHRPPSNPTAARTWAAPNRPASRTITKSVLPPRSPAPDLDPLCSPTATTSRPTRATATRPEAASDRCCPPAEQAAPGTASTRVIPSRPSIHPAGARSPVPVAARPPASPTPTSSLAAEPEALTSTCWSASAAAVSLPSAREPSGHPRRRRSLQRAMPPSRAREPTRVAEHEPGRRLRLGHEIERSSRCAVRRHGGRAAARGVDRSPFSQVMSPSKASNHGARGGGSSRIGAPAAHPPRSNGRGGSAHADPARPSRPRW